MDRVLRSAGGTLTLLNYDGTGALADAGAASPGGLPTNVAVTDGAGAAVATLTPTHPSLGTYLAALPTTLAALDTFTVTWTMADTTIRTTYFETVGAFLFTVADVRAYDVDLADAAKYPAATIVAMREIVEEVFEHPLAGRVAFRPRGSRDVVSGTGRDRIRLLRPEPTKIVSLVVDATTTFTAGDIADLRLYPSGKVVRNANGLFNYGVRNVACFYEHGLPAVPAPIRRAATRYCKHLLVKTALETSERATAVFTDIGGYRLSIAGRDGFTGLPEVDAELERWSMSTWGVRLSSTSTVGAVQDALLAQMIADPTLGAVAGGPQLWEPASPEKEHVWISEAVEATQRLDITGGALPSLIDSNKRREDYDLHVLIWVSKLGDEFVAIRNRILVLQAALEVLLRKDPFTSGSAWYAEVSAPRWFSGAFDDARGVISDVTVSVTAYLDPPP